MAQASTNSRIRSIVFCGLSVALITVSAWISIPIGPVPFTLQTFAVAFILLVLKPKEAMATIVIYLLLGAVGLPVFSSMRGGLGVLLGPTGGFLWGYILGGAAALAVLQVARRRVPYAIAQDSTELYKTGAPVKKALRLRPFLVDFAALLVYLVVSYLCGWLYFMVLSGVGPLAAFLTALAPFIVIDLFKLVAAVITARAVNVALPKR